MLAWRNIRLVMTCGACPEQYDAFDEDGNLVGYFRLRHGHFSVSYIPPNSSSDEWEVVYSSNPRGDGIFDDDERDFHLIRGMESLSNRLSSIDPPTYLKDCPFCGWKMPDMDNLIDTVYPDGRSGLYKCTCGCCSAMVLGYTPEDAMRCWNMRKEDNE